MAKTLRLLRIGFVAWLIAPVVLVAILWTQMDRSEGKPDPRFMHKPVNGAAQPETRMVEPESLPQGFVILVEDKSKLAGPEYKVEIGIIAAVG